MAKEKAQEKLTKKRDTRTRAQKLRAIRQDEMRANLSARGMVEYVIELAGKIEDAVDKLEVDKYKASADIRLKLINKYLPDLRTTELTGEGGGAIQSDTKWTIEVVEHKKDA